MNLRPTVLSVLFGCLLAHLCGGAVSRQDDLGSVPPNPPINVYVLSFDGTQAIVSWSNLDQRTTTLILEKSTDGIRWTQAATSHPKATKCMIDKLSASNSWSFRIRAQNALGVSSLPSRPATVTIYPASR